MNDLIEKLSSLRSQFNCFNENERDAYSTLSEAIKVISERPEPCEDDNGCSNCMYSGRPTYKSPCSECHNNSQWEIKPISRSRENGAEYEDAVSRADVVDMLEMYPFTEYGEYESAREAVKRLPSVTLKPDHSGDTTEMVECDDAVSRTDMLNELDGWIEGFDVNGHKESHADMKLVRRSMNQLPSVTPKPQIGELVVEECDDTVSRRAVIEEIKVCFNMSGCDCGNCKSIIEHINSLPSVTPKRKKWNWIEYDSDEDKYDVIKCPCCKHTFTVDAYHWTDIGFVKDDFKFCPNCSADMRGNRQ